MGSALGSDPGRKAGVGTASSTRAGRRVDAVGFDAVDLFAAQAPAFDLGQEIGVRFMPGAPDAG